MTDTEKKTARGFAAMMLTPEGRRRVAEIASKGGKSAHAAGTAHEFTRAEAIVAGRKGGRAVSKNRQHMAEIGKMGGEAAKTLPRPISRRDDDAAEE